MMVEIRGVQFINKGAELMLEAIYSRLKTQYGESVQIALAPRNSPYYERSKYRAFQKMGNQKFRIDWSYLSWILPNFIKRDLGLVTYQDIDVVLDASGFAYGDQWTPSMFRSSVRLAEHMKSKGGKYIFMPQAMGPFTSHRYKNLLIRAVDAAEIFYVRDQKSYEYVTSVIGENKKVILSPDFTNLIEPKPVAANQRDLCIVIPNSKMLKMQSSAISSSYIEMLQRAIFHVIKKGYRVEILNHEGPSDLKICNSLYSKHLNDDNVLLVDNLDALQVKQKIAEATFCISSRFHGCVSSLSQGIPVIATSWSHKYEMLFSDYAVDNFVYKFDQDIEHMINELIDNYDRCKSVIYEKSLIEKEKANEMWCKIYSCIGTA